MGTPLAIVAGIGRAARCGAIVKGGAELEALAHIDTVVFDKTGTLTEGSPSVQRVEPHPPFSAAQLLQAAAQAEASSEHPLAKAVVRADNKQSEGSEWNEPVASFESVVGMGVLAVRRSGEKLRVGSRRWLEANGVSTAEFNSGKQSEGGGIWVAIGERLMGRIAVDDALRPNAVALIARLKGRGLRQVLLTGDSMEAAHRVAAHIGIVCFTVRLHT